MATTDADAAQQTFSALRGRAIDSYATLEHAVCHLFATVTGMASDVAPIVFFKITAPRFVHVIIEKLLKKQHGTTYRTFWNSVSKKLDALSQKRNSIVHWTIVATTVNNVFMGVELRPGHAILGSDANLDDVALSAFIAECRFLAELIFAFNAFLQTDATERPHPWGAVPRQTWHDIFQQEVIYPPPCTHPLFQIPAVH